MKTIPTVFENGTFRPLEPVDFAEGSRVDIEAKRVHPPIEDLKGLEATYAILGERYDSGQHDVAERHNEHQP